MARKRKLSIILATIVSFAFILSSAIAPIYDKRLNKAEADGGQIVEYSIKSYITQENSSPENGKLFFKVGVSLFKKGETAPNEALASIYQTSSSPIYESATIYVKTRDLSAISSKGDYKAKDEAFTIYGNKMYTEFSIEVGSGGLEIEGYKRQFSVEIYKVEYTGINEAFRFDDPLTTPEVSSVKASVNGDIVVEYDRKGYSGYSASYLPVLKSYTNSVTGTIEDDQVKTYTVNLPQDYIDVMKYLYSKNGIKLAAQVDVTAKQTSSSSIWVQDGYGVVKLEAGYLRYAQWYIKYESNGEEFWGISNSFEGEFDDVTVSTFLRSGVTRKKDKNQILIDDFESIVGNAGYLKALLYLYQGDKHKTFSSSKIVYKPLNYQARVEEAFIGQLRYDSQGNRKLGLSIRYSEPMQFITTYKEGEEIIPTITANINGNASNTIDFEYVCGEGTDTFYFEADVTSVESNISSLRLSNTTGFDKVYDYAPATDGETPMSIINSSGALNGWDNVSIDKIPCSFDLRIPEINLNGQSSTAVKKTHSVNLSTSGISDTGKILYKWIDSDPTAEGFEPPEDFEQTSVLQQGFQTIKSPLSISGKRWFYAKAVSAIGLESKDVVICGPFYFDNESPYLEVGVSGNYMTKTLTLRIDNNDSNIEKIADINNVIKIIACSDTNATQIIKEDKITIKESDYKTDANGKEYIEVTYTISAIELQLQENEYGKFYFKIFVSDQLENQTEVTIGAYDFDRRQIFDVTYVADGHKISEIDGSYLGERTYALNLANEGGGITFTADSTIELAVDTFENLKETSPKVATNYKTEASKTEGSVKNNVLKIVFEEGFESGLYRLILKDSFEESGKKTLEYLFYITNGMNDETEFHEEANNGTVLTNSVFQLPSDLYYYYTTASGSVQKVDYKNSKNPTTFSSYDEAFTYIYYYEKLDLFAVQLTEAMAESLNNGLGYYKAEDEDHIAKAGQIWIRYKESRWKPGTNLNNVYYYYCEGENATFDGETIVINLDAISIDLELAMIVIAYSISEYGQEVELISYEQLDSNGFPTLADDQLCLEAEVSSYSKSGTKFSEEIGYYGDGGIYVSNSSLYPLVSNAKIEKTQNKRVFYSQTDSDFELLEIQNGKTLKQMINGNGTFFIIELDENGINKYQVEIDTKAPRITVSWDNGSSVSEFDSEKEGQVITGNSFIFTGINDEDPLAYVALYKHAGHSEVDLIDVYKASYFEGGNQVSLTDGLYHVFVSDRSGNSFSFIIQVCSKPLKCSIKEVKNTYIQLSTNRTESEIRRYYVYLDGTLVASKPSQNRFTESGYYQILIEDIYGYVYDDYYYEYKCLYETDDKGNEILDEYGDKIPILDDNGNKIYILDENGNRIPIINEDFGYHVETSYHFKRDSPVVEWKYQTSDGKYVSYNANTSVELKITQKSETDYLLSTSTSLQFLLKDGCVYEILSGSPSISESLLQGIVTIKSIEPFKMKVYYEKHPEIFVTYTCLIDNISPSVSVTYQEGSFVFSEYADIEQDCIDGKFELGVPNVYVPSNIGYVVENEKMVNVVEASTVFSNLFKVKAFDENGIKSVEVFLDGELILQEKSDFSNIVLSRFGNYEIVATDNFGNERIFTFTNKKHNFINCFIDGEEIDLLSLTDVFYGQNEIDINLPNNAEVYFLIKGEFGQQYVAFLVEDGNVYPYVYEVTTYEQDGKMGIANVASVKGEKFNENSLAKVELLGVEIYYTVNKEGVMSFLINSYDNEKKTYSVDIRIVVPERNEPYFISAKLSNKKSTISFIDDEDNPISATSNVININNPFKIDENLDEYISSVKVAYSQTGRFEDYQVVYDGNFYQNFFDKEGMYHILVENVYGIVNEYRVNYSLDFLITAVTEFADDTFIEYSTHYIMNSENDVIYSNKLVEFIVYSSKIYLTINGTEQELFSNENGYVEFIVNAIGENSVFIKDEFGNQLFKTVKISNQPIVDNANLLEGFNQDALRLDENYTNQKISVNKDVLEGIGASYLSVTYNGETNVLYDLLSEEKIALDEETLVRYIGSLGDGEYIVTIRDRYGSKLEKVVNYRGTPTLTIMRKISSGVEFEEYPIEKMMENGVWTNASVTFNISASEYVLLVDGKQNVMTISYDTKTKNDYSVYYLDEYGFKYEFVVHLFRQDIEISASENISVLTIDDHFVTRDNISVNFTKNTTCTYVLDGLEERAYSEGEVLYKDGVYRFKVVDLAGNSAVYVIEKDSAVEYKFESGAYKGDLISGDVVNNSTVEFFPVNSDSAYIKKVVHNGELIEYSDTRFNDSGKWEIILSDEVGNETYFRFYIITGKVSEFNYQTPYEYLITSVTWELEGSSVVANEVIKDSGKRLELTANGFYTVIMQSTVTGDQRAFTINIDNTPPQVELNGCLQNEKTINNVTISGCEVGDTVYVYRDGKLVQTVQIESNFTDAPVISEGGKYKIVVENEAGVKTELLFERQHIPNTWGSVLIIIISLAVVVGLMVGLIWRNHSKTDD